MSGRLGGVLPISGSASNSPIQRRSVRIGTLATTDARPRTRTSRVRPGGSAGGGGGGPHGATAPVRTMVAIATIGRPVQRGAAKVGAGVWELCSAMTTANRANLTRT